METIEPTPIFSVEIFELIVDQVDYQEDGDKRKAELSALALVCRALAELCQGRFLREMTVATQSCADYLRRASEYQIQLLNSKPFLVKYVRQLTCWGPWEDGIPDDSRLVTDPTSQLILLSLHLLATLSIEANTSYKGPGTRIFGHRQLLDYYISTDHLTTLNINGVADLPILRILGCPGLVELKIVDCLFSSDWKHENHAQVSDAISRGFRLQRLDICIKLFQEADGLHPLLVYCNDLQVIQIYMEYSELASVPEIELPFPSLSYGHLGFRRLESIHAENADWTYFCELADQFQVQAFPKLKTMTLNLHEEVNVTNNANILFRHIAVLESLNLYLGPNATAHLLDLSTCITNSRDTLKYISLEWGSSSADPPSSGVITTLIAALKAVRKTNVIETIKLRSPFNIDNPPDAVYFESWSMLSKLFVDHHRVMFPYLRRVEVIFWIENKFTVGGWDRTPAESDVRTVTGIISEPLKRIVDMINYSEVGSKEGVLRCKVFLQGPEELEGDSESDV